jgi:hypothetical protein
VSYSEAQLQSVADDRCRRSAVPLTSLPPHRFTTDGCTLSPNGSWTECCIAHDMAYWCGGPATARRAADRSLSACVESHGHPLLAEFMYVGVRLGGTRWLPLPWRWGYGYSWPWGATASGASLHDAGGKRPPPAMTPSPDVDTREF